MQTAVHLTNLTDVPVKYFCEFVNATEHVEYHYVDVDKCSTCVLKLDYSPVAIEVVLRRNT